MLPHQASARKIEGRDLRVRRFLVVIVEILAAAARYALGRVETEDMAGEIEAVNAVVAQFAGPVIPEPVPVVMKAILVERPLRRRPKPEIVIDAVGNRAVRLVADGFAVAADPASGKRNFAELARLDEFAGAGDMSGATPLCPHLHHALVLAGRLDHLAAFDEVVRDRFLDVHVLAGLAGPDGRQRVPVVR